MELINTYLILPVYDLYIIKGSIQSNNKKKITTDNQNKNE